MQTDQNAVWLSLRALLGVAALLPAGMARAEPPRLVPHGSALQLAVQGKPKLLIAGELGNSSASSAAYMAPHWPKLRAMHLNTVLAPVSWELIEPREGQFDWSSVDALVASARANDLKLILLWFGAWKNSMSTYPPGVDQARQCSVPTGAASEWTERRDSVRFCAADIGIRPTSVRRIARPHSADRRPAKYCADGAGRK